MSISDETDETYVVDHYGYISTEDIVYNTEKYTEDELDAMTKAEILELGRNLLLEMSTSSDNTKDEIIADFLTAQG